MHILDCTTRQLLKKMGYNNSKPQAKNKKAGAALTKIGGTFPSLWSSNGGSTLMDDLKSKAPEMEDVINRLENKEFITVWVCDPCLHKEDFWHRYIDYGICLHTNSMCFSKKTSYVRRRYSDFVWLRQRLQDNALLVQLPKLPLANPFFSLNNTLQITQRMKGLHKFLEAVLKMPLLLSDSHLHLFLQSRLSIAKMEACVQGQTRNTVTQAIHLEDQSESFCYSDCESTTSSGLSISTDPATPIESSSQNASPTPQFLAMESHPELSES